MPWAYPVCVNVKPSDTSEPALPRRRVVAAGTATLAGSLAAAWARQAVAAAAGPAAPAVAGPGAAPDRDALRAWVDTLLPAEGAAPGALATGVAERIAAAAQSNGAYGRLLVAGLAWADAEARRDGVARFAALPAGGREAIVSRAEAAPAGTTPRTFFQATLDDVHYHHWADPRSWPALGYAGPPQPAGFMDHGEPPQGRR